MDWLHFLNLQYWYCLIYSVFGGECGFLDKPDKQPLDTVVQNKGVFETLFDTLYVFYASTLRPILHVVGGGVSFLWDAYSALAWTVSGILFFVILSALIGFLFIRFRELYTYGTLPPEEKKDNPVHDRWQELLEYAKSTDPKLWRKAILEADTMLGDLLERLGYQGVNTAEKMKMLPEDAFVTVPVAWEAHRVRNFVSSGSSDFILTQREAFRVMKLYEQVFEEFNFV